MTGIQIRTIEELCSDCKYYGDCKFEMDIEYDGENYYCIHWEETER